MFKNKEDFISIAEEVSQGRVISPLLVNIVLNGLEPFLESQVGKRKIKVIRYVNDILVCGRRVEDVQKAQLAIEEFLKPIGLQLNKDRTKIRHSVEKLNAPYPGVYYLGYHFYQKRVSKRHAIKKPSGELSFVKVVTRPSWTAIKDHLHDISCIIKKYKAVSQVVLIGRLMPIIRN